LFNLKLYLKKKSLNYQDHQGPPLPLPLGEDKWDDDHVKMPFSNQNVNENKMV
jgi:hypothetical protein